MNYLAEIDKAKHDIGKAEAALMRAIMANPESAHTCVADMLWELNLHHCERTKELQSMSPELRGVLIDFDIFANDECDLRWKKNCE